MNEMQVQQHRCGTATETNEITKWDRRTSPCNWTENEIKVNDWNQKNKTANETMNEVK